MSEVETPSENDIRGLGWNSVGYGTNDACVFAQQLNQNNLLLLAILEELRAMRGTG